MVWIRQGTLVALAECRLQVATALWRAIVLMSAALAVAVTQAGLAQYTRRQIQVDLLVAQRDQTAEHGQHAVNGFQRDEALRVIRRPAPLSVLVGGLDTRLSQYWDFGPEGISAGATVSGQPLVSVVSADLDLEFILRGLIGLLAIAAGFGSMAASRPRGPTKSLVSLPVRPSALVAGAMAGGTVAVAVAAAVVIGSAIVTLLAGDATLVSSDAMWSLLLIWLVSMWYGVALVGTGAAVAVLVIDTSRALAVATVLWLLATTLGGPLAGALAEGISPSQSRTLFEVSRNAEYQESSLRVETDAGRIVLEALGATDVPAGFQLSGVLLERVAQHWDRSLATLRRRLDQLDTDFRHKEAARAANAWWVGVVFPGTAFGSALSEVADVGEAAAHRWIDDGEAYQRILSAAVFDMRTRLVVRLQSGSRSRVVFHDRGPRPTVGELPAFRQQKATAGTRFSDAAPSMLVLTLQGVVVWLVAIVAFMRRPSGKTRWL